jgi:hypothetical protein
MWWMDLLMGVAMGVIASIIVIWRLRKIMLRIKRECLNAGRQVDRFEDRLRDLDEAYARLSKLDERLLGLEHQVDSLMKYRYDHHCRLDAMKDRFHEYRLDVSTDITDLLERVSKLEEKQDD